MSRLADPSSNQPLFHVENGTRPEDQQERGSTGPASEIQTPEERADEARRIRRLQILMDRVMLVLRQDRSLTVERASALVADARRAALVMFPDKASTFDLIYWPRLQRLMRERYRMQ